MLLDQLTQAGKALRAAAEPLPRAAHYEEAERLLAAQVAKCKAKLRGFRREWQQSFMENQLKMLDLNMMTFQQSHDLSCLEPWNGGMINGASPKAWRGRGPATGCCHGAVGRPQLGRSRASSEACAASAAWAQCGFEGRDWALAFQLMYGASPLLCYGVSGSVFSMAQEVNETKILQEVDWAEMQSSKRTLVNLVMARESMVVSPILQHIRPPIHTFKQFPLQLEVYIRISLPNVAYATAVESPPEGWTSTSRAEYRGGCDGVTTCSKMWSVQRGCFEFGHLGCDSTCCNHLNKRFFMWICSG